MPQILDIPLYSKSISSIVKEIIQITINGKKENRLISATGAHGIVYAQSNKNFKKILKSFYTNLPDGMPGVWIGRMKGAKEMQRCYGPDFFKELIISSSDKNIKHYFCGGKEGVAKDLKKACEEKFGNKNICGTFSPPFREMTDDELKILAEEINIKNIDVVWIGLSTPKQEVFAYRLSKFTNVHFICTVGAAFDFHTGLVKQAPKFMQNLSLEWFFRLLVEPKRLWKRYFEIVPMFIFYNLQEFLHTKIFNKNKGVM